MNNRDALLARREAAEKTTPGPWKTDGRFLYALTEELDGTRQINIAEMMYPYREADAAHIAANDPTTIMADIDEILRLREEMERLEKEANWLARAASNNGWIGARISPEWMRDAARKAVEESCPKK